MPEALTHPLQSDDVRLMTEVGMVAAASGQHGSAVTIFEALLRLRPRRAFPYIGLATTFLNEGQPEEAESFLRRGLLMLSPGSHEPHAFDDKAQWAEDRALLESFHGLALQLCGRTAESRQALERCLAIQGEGAGARMARLMLGLPQPQQIEGAKAQTECYP